MTDIAVPPDDIAGLIEGLVLQGQYLHDQHPEQTLQWRAVAALRSQAQHIRQLEAEIEKQREHCQTANADREHDAAEIERLEAERDEWKQCAKVEAQVRREFKEMLAAIERKTIEECAKIADFRYFSADAAKAIRALATAPAREDDGLADDRGA